MSRRGWFLFTLMCVVWGVPYLLIRISVRDLEPATLVFFRTAPAGLALAPWAWRAASLAALRRRWPWLVAYTVAELGVPWLLLSTAEERLASSLTALLVATVPLLGLVLARLFGGNEAERVDRRRMLGLLLGLTGVAVLVGVDVHGASLAAVGEVGVVALGYATGPLIISRRLSDLPGTPVVAASLLLTAAGYAPWALTHLPHHVTTEVVASVATLAMVCTAVAFLLFFALIAEVGPARATVITYFNPAVALLLGVSILGEPLTVGLALGFPLVLLGSVLGTGGTRPGARRGRYRARRGVAP